MYMGFGGVFAILAFIMFFFAIAGEGVGSVIGWMLVFIFGIGSWFCYAMQKDKDEEELMKKQKETSKKLEEIPNYKSTQRYTSPNGDVTLSIDENTKKITFVNINANSQKIYKYGDILKSEILTDGISVTSTNRGSQIGGALLGGVLAGGIGAIIGGLSGSQSSEEKVKKIELNVIVNDTVNPIHKISFLDSEFTSYTKSSQEYKDAYKTAYHCHQLMGVLIRQADEDDKQKENAKQNESSLQSISVADELRKFSQLRDDGILSVEEFEIQKKRLIG
ncbi:SHOCT domain-containing protein [Paenibacillus macquariensis]|uniref:SHOCT domain-containing protein n=1 Tax=Paenibacillus macquariensis TaxID=948756 RepID=A0ABY1JKA7_9BACL|nr:SHOCT domain-containing protein [Paenibacillus macquariensis]MEC0089894.1 SHOCT domain-containing protein [Paenibacillus macquariensis]OAB30645.1 hypothetical protein PMSM_21070 [Paenibacillus macquariensis subsp. macquariensis]SIQ33791.1 hypothetical protein SAMN05421578_101280 [Paenibacillus macquariensis]